MNTVYIYKTWNDCLAYGEEIIEVYDKKEDALQRLSHDVKEEFGGTPKELRNDPTFTMDCLDSMEDDYVAVARNDGSVDYFIVEAKERRN